MFIRSSPDKPGQMVVQVEYYDGKTLLSMAGERIRYRKLYGDEPMSDDTLLESWLKREAEDSISNPEGVPEGMCPTSFPCTIEGLDILDRCLMEFEDQTTDEALGILAVGNLPGFVELAQDRRNMALHAHAMRVQLAAERLARETGFHQMLGAFLETDALERSFLTLE